MKNLTPAERQTLSLAFDAAVKGGKYKEFYEAVAEAFGEDPNSSLFRDKVSFALDDAERFMSSPDPEEEGEMYPLLGDFLDAFKRYSSKRADYFDVADADDRMWRR